MRTQRRPKGAVAVGFLVVIVLAAGVVSAVRELRMPAASPGAAPEVAETTGVGSWRRIRQPEFGPPQPVTEIDGLSAPGGGVTGWLGVGVLRDYTAGSRAPAVWTSPDAERWRRAALPAASTDTAAYAVARQPGRTVAVGAERGHGDRDAVAWSTTTGDRWERVPVASQAGDQDLTMVAAGPAWFVAAGTDRKADTLLPLLVTSPDGMAWRQVDTGPGSEFGPVATIDALAASGSGLVAVGSTTTATDRDASAWFSPDGTAWRRVTLPASATGPGDQVLTTVVASRTGFFAAGPDGRTGRQASMELFSPDGQSWERLPPDSALGFGDNNSVGISIERLAGPGPLTAVNSRFGTVVWRTITNDDRRWAAEDSPADLAQAPGVVAALAYDGVTAVLAFGDTARPSLWVSPKVTQWHEVAPDAAALSRADKLLSAAGVVAGPGGLLLFTKEVDQSTGHRDTVVWTSADGQAWARQPDPAGVFRQAEVQAVIRWRDGVVAVGQRTDSGSDPMAWTSADGVTWARAPADQPGLAHEALQEMLSVVEAGPGLVAVGFRYANAVEFDAEVWTSPDGLAWTKVTPASAWGGPNDQFFWAACRAGATIQAVGYETHGPERDGFAFTSTDGVAWTSAPGAATGALRGPGGQSMRACTSAAGGAVAVGWNEGLDTDARVWTTTDGASWNSVASPALGGPGDQLAYAAASDGRRLVIGGRDGVDPAVWTSLDGGHTWERLRPPDGLFSGLGRSYIGAVAIAGDQVIAAGIDDDTVALWTGRLPRS